MEYQNSYSPSLPTLPMKKFYRGISNIFGVVADVVVKDPIVKDLPPLLEEPSESIHAQYTHVHEHFVNVAKTSSQTQLMSLVDIEWLKGHEQIVSEERVQKLHDAIVEWEEYRLPLLVDSRSGAILDGHHRFAVGQIMGLSRLPVVLVDYLNDDSISVDVWPECGYDCLTKEEVVQMSLSESLYPPKTSKHDCISLKPINVPLSHLR